MNVPAGRCCWDDPDRHLRELYLTTKFLADRALRTVDYESLEAVLIRVKEQKLSPILCVLNADELAMIHTIGASYVGLRQFGGKIGVVHAWNHYVTPVPPSVRQERRFRKFARATAGRNVLILCAAVRSTHPVLSLLSGQARNTDGDNGVKRTMGDYLFELYMVSPNTEPA